MHATALEQPTPYRGVIIQDVTIYRNLWIATIYIVYYSVKINIRVRKQSSQY